MRDIYRVALFKDEGFHRKRCETCSRTFWTLDPNRKTCGDTPCDEYAFIGRPPIRRRYNLFQMESAFLKFFEMHGHTVINRYPVVARWRDDIFLTIASIANFQPWVTSGQVPPPANPLVVSQPSIRLKDIDNVGRSGRHFTLFFMGGHHAFNSRKKRIYWTDETVALCHEFLTRELGILPEEISYIQDFWEGGGNAGEDFEVNVRGLELATLVFMHYLSKDGEYELLPLNIVDTGYGMERLTWASHGTASSYEAVFEPVVKKLRELAGVKLPPPELLREHSKLAGLMDIETGRDLLTLRTKAAARTGLSVDELSRLMAPLEAVYAIADHLRCLVFMFGDGITPSNVQEGYLARLVLRRTLRLMRELGLQEPLAELVQLEIRHLVPHFPEFGEREGHILEVAELEEQRYLDAISRGERLVKRLVGALREEGKPLSAEKLTELYDSHGLPPEVVREIATEMGTTVDVPEDFYIRVAKLHGRAERAPVTVLAIPKERLRGIPPTKAVYYDDPYAKEFHARVLGSFDGYVMLDRTAFYPEGGGQPADLGKLISHRGKAKVVDVQKVDGVIAHQVKPNIFKTGQKVRGEIDWARRSSLMRHHIATHILLGAARRVLGNHVWQHGVQKGVDRTRLDISHFKRVEPIELREIERLANQVVMENRAVFINWMDRNVAEREYGFDLYQGGVVPGKQVRIVDIDGWNTQACAGTHCLRTGDVGLIKIVHTERIQDGIERLEFVAGEAALNFIQKQEEQFAKAAGILRAPLERVAAATQRLFDEWKSTQKEVTRLQERLAELRLVELRAKAKRVGAVRVICEEVKGANVEELIQTASALVRGDKSLVVMLATCDEMARLVVMAGEAAIGAGIDCGEIAAAAAGILGGGGGGKREMGQGGGPEVKKLGEALTTAVEVCERQQR
ncbi:MAG: alanine--tRNA ligase [Candidatus Hodarchaeaceae archaeon]|nr:alanine--tRNA ligase [Candidatus Hodarchaeaceae archaeon]